MKPATRSTTESPKPPARLSSSTDSVVRSAARLPRCRDRRRSSTHRRIRACLALLLLASAPSSAAGGELRWEGSLEADFATLPPLRFPGAGVATLTSSGVDFQLKRLRLDGGISGSGTIPITDPDGTHGFESIRISASLGTGTLSPFSPLLPWPEPQLERNTLPIRGQLRICLLTSNCATGILAPLGTTHDTIGVGGVLTVGGFGDLRVSIDAAPWTVYSATLPLLTTLGGTTPWQRTGWIHGPASYSSSAATTGGALQLVTPVLLRSNAGLFLPGFTSLTLRFIPEPGALLSIAAGILALTRLHRANQHRSRRNEGKSR